MSVLSADHSTSTGNFNLGRWGKQSLANILTVLSLRIRRPSIFQRLGGLWRGRATWSAMESTLGAANGGPGTAAADLWWRAVRRQLGHALDVGGKDGADDVAGLGAGAAGQRHVGARGEEARAGRATGSASSAAKASPTTTTTTGAAWTRPG